MAHLNDSGTLTLQASRSIGHENEGAAMPARARLVSWSQDNHHHQHLHMFGFTVTTFSPETIELVVKLRSEGHNVHNCTIKLEFLVI